MQIREKKYCMVSLQALKIVSSSANFVVTCSTAMMTSSNGNIFRVIGPLWDESTGHRWIPITKASDAEQTAEQAVDLRRHGAHYDVNVMTVCHNDNLWCHKLQRSCHYNFVFRESVV